MTDVPDWDHDHPFEKWEPSHAEHARAGELWEQMLDDDPAFCDKFDGACADVLLLRNLPSFLAAVMAHGRDLIEGNCSDRKLARRRLAGAVAEARDEVVKEMLWHDDTD